MTEDILTCSNCGYETSEVDQATGLCQTCKNAYDLNVPAVTLEQITNEVLSNFLTDWNREQSLYTIFEESNSETIVWEQYCDWDLDLLHDHILQLINGLVTLMEGSK